MLGCVLSQLKPSELYILSCGKGHGLRPRPFPHLRMWSSSGFILYEIIITVGSFCNPSSPEPAGERNLDKYPAYY